MPNLSSNIAAALDLAGVSGPAAQYPNLLGRTGRIVNQVARAMMREARLSDQNQYIKFLPLTSPSKETSIPSISDPNSICLVELLTDSVNDGRVDIQIVNRNELNVQEDNGNIVCARFGRPTKIRFTWNPDSEAISGLGSDTIYVGYENIPSLSETDMNSIPALPESFHDCIQYRTAALVKETILKEPCTPIFLDMMKTIEGQWKEWTTRDAEERVVQKGAFGSLGMSDYAGDWC